MSNVDNQISRMITMMNYGLKTENKTPYSTVEYHRVGADGKMYGIVREGTKYYIKVSETTKGDVLKENFEYLGGFVNRSRNEYTSYASALKNFDQKMKVIKENYETKNVITEAWNPNAKNEVMAEATNAMRKEIARQRQIMSNASRIAENKEQECCGAPFCDSVSDAEDMDGLKSAEKANIKKEFEPVRGKGAKKKLKEAEVLGWNDDNDYLDTTHGTHIGDGAPFDKKEKSETEMHNGVVEEDVAMHAEGDNQNSPAVGTGEIGDDDPFTKNVGKSKLKEADEFDNADNVEDEDFDTEVEDADFDTEVEDTDDDFDADMAGDDFDFEDDDTEEFNDDFDSDLDDTDDDFEADDFDGDIESRLSAVEDILAKIAEKLGVDEFDDDTLYDDDETSEDDTDVEDEADVDLELDGDDDFETGDEETEFEIEADEDDTDADDDDDIDDEDDDVMESRSYRRMKRINEDRLDYFGKHPAYRKQPMKLPKTGSDSTEHGRDWNDDSVHNEKPFGKQIGSGAPFEVTPEDIDNAIAEAIKKVGRKNL